MLFQLSTNELRRIVMLTRSFPRTPQRLRLTDTLSNVTLADVSREIPASDELDTVVSTTETPSSYASAIAGVTFPTSKWAARTFVQFATMSCPTSTPSTTSPAQSR